MMLGLPPRDPDASSSSSEESVNYDSNATDKADLMKNEFEYTHMLKFC
jgi:hypothetical protein